MAIPNEFMQEQMALEGQARARLHDETGRSGPTFIKDNDMRDGDGAKAEWAFGKLCGIMPDTTLKASGDKGIDFWVPFWMSVDVKASRHPGHLIVSPDRVKADLFVLYDTHPDWPEPCPMGWATQKMVLNAERDNFGKDAPPAYKVPAGELKDFMTLVQKIRQHKLEGRVI